MSTFQFKNKKYILTPPQEGANSIVNTRDNDTSFKQDISNLPITTNQHDTSINFLACAYIALQESLSSTVWSDKPTGFQEFMDSNVGGRKLFDPTGGGDQISTADALAFLKVHQKIPLGPETNDEWIRQEFIPFVEGYYSKWKDVFVVQSGSTYNLFNGPPKNKDATFDIDSHYIIADASDEVDRLKLIKYYRSQDFRHAYWFDAGNGSETKGLAATGLRGNKAANSGQITGREHTFDASSNAIAVALTNKFLISNHGYTTGDKVAYDDTINHVFDASDSSIVNLSNNTITIPNHGYTTGNVTLYDVLDSDIAIAPLTGPTHVNIERVDDNTIKFRDISHQNVIDITGLGQGLHSLKISQPFATHGHMRFLSVSVLDPNHIQFLKADGSVATFTGTGVGTAHKLFPGFTQGFAEKSFVAVSEEATFDGSSGSVVNTSNNTITTSAAHGYSTGDTTVYKRDVGPIIGLSHNRLYYVIRVDDTTVKLATSAENAANGIAVNLTNTGQGSNHKLVLEYGTEVYRVDDRRIYTNTSDEVVFTNRILKTPNISIDPKNDIMLAKVYAYETIGQVKTTESVATTNHAIKNIDTQRFRVGSIITSGISGNPKVTAVTFTHTALGLEAAITIDSAQTATADTDLVFKTFAQEPYFQLDAGDTVLEDETPKLGGNLDLNSNNISDGTHSVGSFTNESQRIASNPSDSSLPTSAAVRAFVNSATPGGGHPLTTSTAASPTSFTYDGTHTGQDNFVAGTYTGISTAYHVTANPNTSGTGGEVTIVVGSDKTVTSVTATTAGSGYKVGDQIIVQGSSLGSSVNGTAISLYLRVNQVESKFVDTTGTPAGNQFARFTDANTLEGRTASDVLSDIGAQGSLTFGIADTNAVKINAADVQSNDFARFTSTGLKGRSAAEVLSDIGAQASLTFGIADNNAVEIDSASVADDDYAKFTANGLEGRNASEVKTDLSLNNVENTAISTFAGSANITTVGTVSTGTWQGTAIADAYISSAGTWNGKQDALTFGIADTNAVKIDHNGVVDNDYAKFTANGLEGRSANEVKTDLSLNNVENTALSTGTALNATNATNAALTNTTNSTCSIVLSEGATGNQPLKTNSQLTFDASTAILTLEEDEPTGFNNPEFKIKRTGNTAGLGSITFEGDNNASTPETIEYVRLLGSTTSTADGSEKGSFTINTISGSSYSTNLQLYDNITKVGQDLKFDTGAITSRINQNTPDVRFRLQDLTDQTSMMLLDDRVYLSAYGLYLNDSSDGSNIGSLVANRDGGNNSLFSNNLFGRASTVYFVKLNQTGLAIHTRGHMRLRDDKYVSFGTSDDVKFFYDNNAISASVGELEIEMESTCQQIRMTDNTTTRFTFARSSGDFTATGNVTAYSDERLKSDIETLDPTKTLQMRGVEFIKDGKKGSGVIAQELEKIAPELVLNEGEYKSVAYGNLSGYLIETIKDQQKQIDELKALVEKLMEKM